MDNSELLKERDILCEKEPSVPLPYYDIGMAAVRVYQNYGSAFTVFALYSLIKDHGKSIILISQPKSSEIDPELPTNFISSPYGETETSKPYASKEEMKALNRICGKFIVGSDQLFNYEIYKRIDGYTLLDWVEADREKVAYATSFGIGRMLGSETEIEYFKKCLKRFRAVSVREDSGVTLLKKNGNIPSVSVLDPVFVCDKRHYIDLISPYEDRVKKGAIFCYVLDPEPKKARIIETVKKELCREHCAVSDMWRSREELSRLWEIETEAEVKNEIWLADLYHSSFVLTDSFHGLCFAIIFEKPFLVMRNRLRGSHRFRSLLKRLGLSERLLPQNPSEEELLRLVNTAVDWNAVNGKLRNEIEYSYHWFKNNVL